MDENNLYVLAYVLESTALVPQPAGMQNRSRAAYWDGKMHKEKGAAWIGGTAAVGCLVMLLASNRVSISPSPERFIGKSPEYVDVYTDAYKARVRQLRAIWLAAGSIGPPIGCFLWFYRDVP